MAALTGYLPREGFTVDVLLDIVKKTALNPALTLPLYMLPFFSDRAKLVSLLFAKRYRQLRLLLLLGLARWGHNVMDWGKLNNWQSDKYQWSREIVLITGGSSGIGALVVQMLSKRSIRIVVLDALPLSYKAGGNVAYYKCDLSNAEELQSVCQTVTRDVGQPTILINNAGALLGKTVLDATMKDVEYNFNVNVLAHYALIKAFLPDMVKNDHGMIVTVTSGSAFVPMPNLVDYASAKAALIALHEGLTAELLTRYKAPKVRTVLIKPGFVRTEMMQGIRNNGGFLNPTLEPATVAEAIVKKVLAGTSGNVALPAAVNALSGLRLLPTWIQLIAREQQKDVMTRYYGRQPIDPNSRKAVTPAPARQPSTRSNNPFTPAPPPPRAPKAASPPPQVPAVSAPRVPPPQAPPPVPTPKAVPASSPKPAAPARIPPVVPSQPQTVTQNIAQSQPVVEARMAANGAVKAASNVAASAVEVVKDIASKT